MLKRCVSIWSNTVHDSNRFVPRGRTGGMVTISGFGETMEIDGVDVPLDTQYPVNVGGHTALVPRIEYMEQMLHDDE